MERPSIKIISKRFLYPLCSGEYRKSQILFIIDSILVNAAIILTTGVFLSGYIIFLGGSDFLVGILNSSSNWASIAAIFSFLVYERMPRRKGFLITLNIISRLSICSIVFLPLVLHNSSLVIGISTAMVVIGNIIWGFYGVGSTVWLMSVLSSSIRNQYIFIRMLALRISFTTATIVLGFVLDWFHKSYTGFLIIFVISLILSILDIIVLVMVKEPVNEVSKDKTFSISAFIEPLKSRPYLVFLVFTFFFYLSQTMSLSFTPLYYIRYMKFNYTFISMVNVICYITMILFTRLWGMVERKRDLKYVLKISSFFLAGELLIYSFLRSNTFFLLYFAPIISGIGNSGFNIALFSYRYEIMPEKNRTIYEGWFGALYGLSTFAAPVIGDFMMKHMPVIHNVIYQYSSFQLLYLISFLMIAVVIFMMFFTNIGVNSAKENSKYLSQ